MISLFRYVLARVGQKSPSPLARHRLVRRKTTGRAVGLRPAAVASESLESRQLLSAGGVISISGYVYADQGHSGAYAAGEGLAGATVTLTQVGVPNFSATTTTLSDGSYKFTGQTNGTYVVTVSQPAGYLPGTITPANSAYMIPSSNSLQTNFLRSSTSGNNFGELLYSPTINTTPNQMIVALGATSPTLTDTATLSGGYNPTGTLQFTLMKGGTVVDTETVNVVAGTTTYTTPVGYVLPSDSTVIGDYQWNTVYSGDQHNYKYSDLNAQNEQVTINQATPTLSTSPNVTAVTLGTNAQLLKDTATLSGGYYESGTITFSLFNGLTLVDTETVNVSGNGTYTTPGYLLPSAGTAAGQYQWNAVYNGDANNLSVKDNNNPNERTVVSAANPTLSTQPNPTTIVLGSSDNTTLTDTATLLGGYNATGIITFSLVNGGVVLDTETINIVPGTTTYTTPVGYTLPTSGAVAGTYQWNASYSGDVNNNATAENGNLVERVIGQMATPTLTTTPTPIHSTLGPADPTFADTALLSGGYYETGTITFTLYHEGVLVDTEVVNVHGDGQYTTPGYLLPTGDNVTGTYQWNAVYSGDSNNNSVSDNDNVGEQFVVSSASPTISTIPNPTVVMLPSADPTLMDTATLANGFNETGTITFKLYLGSTLLDTETVNVNGNGSYTTPVGYKLPTTGTVTGTYQWQSFYSGDSNNNAASETGDVNERVQVVSSTPTLVTVPGPATMTLGSVSSTLNDTATLSGGFNETGTITFTLYFSGNLVDTETVPVNGNGSYTTPSGYTLPTSGTVTGLYQWNASYSGDGNNQSVIDNGNPNEQVTVSPASPSITSTPGQTSLTLGTSPVVLTDTATLDGGFYEQGTITFTLTRNGITVHTETASVNGDGDYSTPTGYALPASAASGTYQWHAIYNSDSNNRTAISSIDSSGQVNVNPRLTSSLSGFVFSDTNASDTFDSGDVPLTGITVTLSGFDGLGNSVNQTTLTDSTGGYTFSNLITGSYTVSTTVPGYLAEISNVGSQASGQASAGVISNITLDPGVNGTANNFGELKSTVAGVTVGQPVGTVSYGVGGTVSFPITTVLNNPITSSSQAATLQISGNLPAGVSASFVNQNITFGTTAPTNQTNTTNLVFTTTTAAHAGHYTFTVTAVGPWGDQKSTTFELDISQANVSYTIASQSQTYGTPAVLSNPTISTGVNGETLVITESSTADTATADVGAAPITGVVGNGSGLFSDYNVTLTNGTLNVTPAALTVTANNNSKTYGTAVNDTGTVSGVLNGDGITATFKSTGDSATSNASNYVIGSTLSDPNNKASNYTITYVDGTLTVNKATATVVVTPYTVTYDGQVHSATVTSITGVNGETGATVGAVTLNSTHTNAGTYASDTWSFAGNSNYNSIASTTITDTVNKANAAVVVTPYTVTYDGQVHSATVTSITGVNGETGATVGSVTLNSTHTNAGTYASDTWSFAGNSNYNSIASTTITDTINKANAAVVVTPYTVAYDGKAHSATVTLITGVNGETGATVGTVTLNSAHTNAGTYATDSWSLTGASNYNNISSTSITDTINKANATVVVTPYSVTYDGKAHSATVTSITGVNGETGATVGTVTLNSTHTNAGTYGTDSWSLTGASNYNNIASTTVTDTINKANAVVVVTPYTVTYDGNSHTATVTSITGVNGETGATAGTVTLNSTHTNAGTYASDSWSLTGASNYNNIASTTIIDTINVPASVITGTSYLDITGNGLTADDTALSGATIKLFLNTNSNSTLDVTTDKLVQTTVTASDGTFSFSGMAPGVYFVEEIPATGYVRTAPTLTDYYTVTVTAGSTNGGYKFDNAVVCDKTELDAASIKFYINGSTTAITDLRGHVNAGDTVQAVFNVVKAGEDITLVSYTAPGAAFDATVASQQQIFQASTLKNATVGVHSLTVVVPNSFFQVDFVCGDAINQFGPAGSNIFFSAQNRLFSADNGDTTAALASTSSLSGYVYADSNNNGVKDAGDSGIGGVTVQLTGTDVYGNSVNATAVTSTSSSNLGYYSFPILSASSLAGYTISVTTPTGYVSGKDSVGSVGGTAGTNQLTTGFLNTNTNAVNYNFGELIPSTSIVTNDTATIGFWQNKNGQCLINSLNGSSSSTALATWLATTYPNLYGSTAGVYSMVHTNGTYFTNAEVAASYVTNFFSVTGQKTNAQVLSAALAVYCTNTTLAGGTYAKTYNFNTSITGSGNHTINVGANGAAFGVANNTVLTLNQLLAYTNSRSSKGIMYGLDGTPATNQGLANTLYSLINTTGDIV